MSGWTDYEKQIEVISRKLGRAFEIIAHEPKKKGLVSDFDNNYYVKSTLRTILMGNDLLDFKNPKESFVNFSLALGQLTTPDLRDRYTNEILRPFVRIIDKAISAGEVKATDKTVETYRELGESLVLFREELKKRNHNKIKILEAILDEGKKNREVILSEDSVISKIVLGKDKTGIDVATFSTTHSEFRETILRNHMGESSELAVSNEKILLKIKGNKNIENFMDRLSKIVEPEDIGEKRKYFLSSETESRIRNTMAELTRRRDAVERDRSSMFLF